MARNCYILIGASGSGKSTLAATLPDNPVVCSADDWFIDSQTGQYKWDAAFLNNAHRYCQKMAAAVMCRDLHSVAIDNTNLREQDRAIYVEMALRFGYIPVYKILPLVEVDELVKRNRHNTPRETLQRHYDIHKQILEKADGTH